MNRIREALLAYAETADFKKLVDETLEEIADVLVQYSEPHVSFSGGKDSTVALHLVLKVKQDTWVFHWDYGLALIPRDIEAEIFANMKLLGAKRIISLTRPVQDETSRHSHISSSGFFDELARLQRTMGWDLSIIALRAEESVRRKVRTKEAIDTSKNPHEYYPIRRWTWRDVWAYIYANKLPVPRIYDRLIALYGHEKARLTTFFDDEFKYKKDVDAVILPGFRNEVIR